MALLLLLCLYNGSTYNLGFEIDTNEIGPSGIVTSGGSIAIHSLCLHKIVVLITSSGSIAVYSLCLHKIIVLVTVMR